MKLTKLLFLFRFLNPGEMSFSVEVSLSLFFLDSSFTSFGLGGLGDLYIFMGNFRRIFYQWVLFVCIMQVIVR